MDKLAKLRIVFGEDDVRKLILPSGIPSTLQDLFNAVQETFHIPGIFSLMYEDMDFGGQFFTLSSIEQVQDKDTLKLVMTQPPVLSLIPMEMSDIDSSVPEESSAASSLNSSASQDTILLSSSDETGTTLRAQPWPAKFRLPSFSYSVDLLLEAGKQAYKEDGTLLNNPRLNSSILDRLAEAIFCYTAYPNGIQVLAVVEALIEQYPCLKEPGSFNGLYGWQQRIQFKMGNYRAKLRSQHLAIPELEVNSLKRRSGNEEHSPKVFKRPKKAEVNYMPPLPFGETENTLEKEREDLLRAVNKKNNELVIGQKMEKSFSYRRMEVVKKFPAVQELFDRWPALFCETQIKDEFRRITTIPLERTYSYTTKLLEIFRAKGGVAGRQLRPMLDSFSQQHVEGRRDVIVRCLVEYLGESGEELIEGYQDLSKENMEHHVMKICVVQGNAAQDRVSIIIEGKEVLGDCTSVARACFLLMGFIYAMNLSYPPKLKYTFEVFQKLFLKLDVFKMSPKVQGLHNKLLA